MVLTSLALLDDVSQIVIVIIVMIMIIIILMIIMTIKMMIHVKRLYSDNNDIPDNILFFQSY